MSQQCQKCNRVVYRVRLRDGKWLGDECGCLREIVQQSAVRAFSDLTLDHILDERGNHVRVTSLRQLQEAEKRYNFASVVGNMDAGNVDTPPQQRVMNVGDMYKWKFNRRQADAHQR